MIKLPVLIQEYLQDFWLEQGKFGYISFDMQTEIRKWHPSVSYYGLTDLQVGDSIEEKLLFLAGLAPYQEKEVIILPTVNFSNGTAANIHIVPVEDENYVLFFDVTEGVRQQQMVQQERHNIDLLYQQQNKNIEILKQTYQELELKKKQAEAANTAKTKLLSYISHDLRTPLTSILGFAQVLAGNVFGELNQQQRDCLKTMLNAGNHMNELIGEIMEAARLESGNMQLHFEPVQVAVAVAESLAWLQPIAEQQQITLINRIAGTVEIQVDRKRFTQILINIINNAIKYNREQGCVVVGCKLTDNYLRISVKDTGIGVADEQIEKMFQPFARVLDKDKAKKIAGNGVGLSECKQLVELMQGSLSVRSELQVGSVFYIDLPLAENWKRQKQSPNALKLVYFYQDIASFELFNNLLLSYKNYPVFACKSVEQAVQLVEQDSDNVVLVEINTDNLTAEIERVQALQKHLNQTVIVAVFEKNSPPAAIKQIFAQTQIADYLIRPFDFNQLLDIL